LYLLYVSIGIRLSLWLLLLVASISGCSLAPRFSEKALENATRIKADSLELLANSNQQYSKHRKEIAELKKDLRRSYEFSKARGNNGEAVKQYEIMMDPNRRMFVGYLSRWESKGRISSEFFRTEARDLIHERAKVYTQCAHDSNL